jgi:hypothetical protein
MDRNWTLREVQVAFNEVDCLFFSCFESWLRMIGQGPTYRSMASCTFEECTESFWAKQWTFGRYYGG